MANEEDSVLREVDQDLAEERQWAQFREHGPKVIAAAIAIVAGVTGWQVWTHMQTGAAEKAALEYGDAIERLAEDRDAGRTALDSVAADNGGYGALARLQRAASFAAGGERLKAIGIYRELANGDAPSRVRQLARLRAAYLSLADGRDAVIAELGGLAESEGPFSYYAKEVLGLAALGVEDYETAVATFRMLSIDIAAPQGVRDRAEEFAALAAAAKAGVNISGEVRVEDLLESIGAPAADESAIADTLEPLLEEAGPSGQDAAPTDENDDHDGHDHEE